MCLQSETIEDLHAVASTIKAEHGARQAWIDQSSQGAPSADDRFSLSVTRAEADRIFADRIAFHEARLKELGWSRTVRVDSQATS
jgi:hypothetical protein